jgi:hypothetical protein
LDSFQSIHFILALFRVVSLGIAFNLVIFAGVFGTLLFLIDFFIIIFSLI